MNDVAFQQRQLTLMFTDIVGYSRLMGRDQAQTIAMLEDYRRILLAQIEKLQGTVIEFIGDAVFARFDTPQAAVAAAVGIQKELFTFNHFRDKSLPRLQTRIGLHCGEVTTRGNAVFGDDVNIAARLEPIAVADGICVSKAVYDAVKDELKEPVLKLGVQPLKNIESKVRAYLIRPLGITFKTRAHYFNRKLNQKLGAYRYPIAAAVALVIISLFYWVPRWLVPGYDANYVEIADFQNLMNTGGEVDYLSGGITEAVRSQLADVRDVYLVKSGEGILAPIKLEGSVQKVGDNLRIAYQLIRRKGNVQIAGGKLDGAYEDIFILQDRVVAEIAKYLAEEFSLPNFRPARIDITSDVLAYDYYMRGLEWLNKPSSEANMDEAIKFFTTALVHDKEFSLANAGLCQAFWKKHALTGKVKLLEKGEEYCKTAIEQDPELPKAIESMGIIYRETGRYDEAIELLRSLVDGNSENIQAVTALSHIYGLVGKFETAEEMLKKAALLQPKSWEIYQALGLLYFQTNEIDKAINQYEKVLDITPNNALALSNLGSAHYFLGNLEKAAQMFEKSVEVMPLGAAYSNAGVIRYYLHDFEKAVKYVEEAIRLAPHDYWGYLNLADAYRHILGENAKSVENYKISLELALKKYQINDRDYEASWAIGHCYLFLGNLENSQWYIENAMQMNPDDLQVVHAYLIYLLHAGRSSEAYRVLGEMVDAGYPPKILKVDPDVLPFVSEHEISRILEK